MIEVLLATYNGARYLREQIDSLLAQDAVGICIVARDDGSTDATAAILAEYAVLYPAQFRVVSGPPTGAAKGNFAALIQEATAEYVAFADQDDVWLPDKISRSVAAMRRLEAEHGAATPLLVFSDLRVVDDELRTLHPSMWRYARTDPDVAKRLPRLLGQSIVTGCTMLINAPMLALARRMPVEATMHDRWIALLAAAIGRAGYVREPTMLYRQHEANVIGAVVVDDSVASTMQRVQHAEGRHAERLRCEAMAAALLREYPAELPAESSATLRAYLRSGRAASGVERLLITLRYGFYRQGVMRTLALLADLAQKPTNEPATGA